MTVPPGATLSYTVTGLVPDAGLFRYVRSAAEIRAAALDQLARAGLQVTRFDLDDSGTMFNLPAQWSYRAILTVMTTVEHGDARDVQAVVQHALWEASGSQPLVTAGADTQAAPRATGSSVPWTSIALVVVGALVLVVWAKP